jgi:hypothetical protein
MILASILLCLSALVLLALSLPRHHRDVTGKTASPARERALRGAGWGLLLLSIVPPIAAFGYAVGIANWVGISAFSTMITAMVVTYWPKLMLPAALLSALIVPALILFAWSV